MLLLLPSLASAMELEMFAAANVTQYDATAEANTAGLSLRTKINFYGQDDRGFFLNLNSRGALWSADWMLGYAWRSKGSWFFEVGGGLGYSPVFGSGIGVLAGTGYRISSSMFVNFPLTISNTGTFWLPYVGYTF